MNLPNVEITITTEAKAYIDRLKETVDKLESILSAQKSAEIYTWHCDKHNYSWLEPFQECPMCKAEREGK